MTKLEAPETPPPGTDARCTQLFGGGGGAPESPAHASRHRKPSSASRGLTRIDSGRRRSRKRRRAARKVKSSRPGGGGFSCGRYAASLRLTGQHHHRRKMKLPAPERRSARREKRSCEAQ